MGSRILAGRYELLEKIGEGGMAVVFKSRDRLLSRFVAIKILRPEYTRDMMFIESFRKESQIAAGLVHPNIVNVYDVGKEGNIYYIVMELIEGRPLSEIIKDEAPLDPYRAADIARQVASALAMAHRHHLIHRDVKPHNIMITGEGVAKITDFGIAKAVNNETLVGEQKEAVMGSVHYFSPEQARGAYVDEKSDIYSLGIVLYEMLTGKVPFDGDTAVAVAVKHMNEEMIPPSSIEPGVPQDLEDIVMRAASKLQTGRYRSADEMITALNFVKYSRPSRGSSQGQAQALPAKNQKEDGRAQDAETAGQTSVSENTDIYHMADNGRKKKPFNWAWIALIAAALILAFPASALVKGLMPDPDDGIQAGDEVEVPGIVGYTSEQASAALAQLGLSLEIDMELPSEEHPAGTVLSQTPDAGAKVKAGQSVKVNISKGVVDGQIPSVVGKVLANAKTTIETYRFSVGAVTEEVSDTVPKGSVIRQTPVAGTSMPAGSPVDLVVSLGTEQEVSLANFNVEGMTLEAAQEHIKKLGLVLGTVAESTNAVIPKGSVISQNPSPGRAFAAGETVDLVVSLGPDAGQDEPAPVNNKSVVIYIDYEAAVSEEFVMTVTVSDAVGSPRTPYNQVQRLKSDLGEEISVEGSGTQGKVLVFFDNALVNEFDVNFENGEIS